ncbi:putative transcriptional regulator, LysR family [Variovorax paradoxus B4]|uniref:Putative transcriptional regulator, LysR family n=1 Tax=Variovorax paradoxus B4 TaxID=1246301 RepID=T1XKI6_VARPD|nr:LysR substrate-binding domain-containing protein [Variovorax paradoxus]AGU53061.1 putative transcriptional regulator, LysR family [Variovorax paradoxus B4]
MRQLPSSRRQAMSSSFHPSVQQRAHAGDVLKECLISFSRDTPQGRIIADWCTSSKVEAASSVEVRSGQMACALASWGAGAGVAIVDDLTARAYRSDELDFRPIVGNPSLGIFALTHGASHLRCLASGGSNWLPLR